MAQAEGETPSDDPYRLLSTVVVTGSSDAAQDVAGSVSFLTDADLSVQAQSDVQRILRTNRVPPPASLRTPLGLGWVLV